MGIDGSIGAISADFTVLLVGLLPCAGGVIVKEKKEREHKRKGAGLFKVHFALFLLFSCPFLLADSVFPVSSNYIIVTYYWRALQARPRKHCVALFCRIS